MDHYLFCIFLTKYDLSKYYMCYSKKAKENKVSLLVSINFFCYVVDVFCVFLMVFELLKIGTWTYLVLMIIVVQYKHIANKVDSYLKI